MVTKRFYYLALIISFLMGFFILACGEGTQTQVSDDDDTTDDDDATDDDDTTDNDDDDNNDDNDDVVDDDDDNDDVVDDDDDNDTTSSENTCTEDSDCSGGEICTENVCMAKPAKDGVTDYGKIDNSCLGNTIEPSGESAILEGCVDAFGLDQTTVGTAITIYKLAENGEIGEEITSAVSEQIAVDKCGNHSFYTTADEVPLDTHLVFKVTGDGFVDSYQYNMLIPSEDAENGKVELGHGSTTANIIANSTYSLIPVLAGIGSIDPGKGVIAGEIHDCNDKQVENAVVGFAPSAPVIVYFAGTDPDPAATSTDPDATYAGVNLPPALYKVVTSTLKDGEVETIGTWKVSTFADSVTIITLDMHQQPF